MSAKDKRHEDLIDFMYSQLLREWTKENWEVLRALIVSRSPSAVREMENRRGLV